MTITATTPATEPTSTDPRHMQHIPTHLIDRDPDQPRKHFDVAALFTLAKSLKKLGQMQPVEVRPNHASPGRYILTMGERRWRAAQRPEAGPLTHLLAIVVDTPDRDVLARATAENLGRADMTVIEEASAFQRLADDNGFSHQEIADMVGKSVQYVRYRIELLNLVPAAKEALTRGHMSTNTAWYVCRLSINAQHTFLRKLARGEFSNADAAAAFAQACRERETVDQGGLFDVQEMTDEEREQVTARRKTIVRKVDQLSRAGEILHDLASADPADLALLLTAEPGGIAGYIQRLDLLRDTAAKAVAKLVKARAVAEAATVTSPAGAPGTLFN